MSCNPGQVSEIPGSYVACQTLDVRECLVVAGKDINQLIGTVHTDGVTIGGNGATATPITLLAVIHDGTMSGSGTVADPLSAIGAGTVHVDGVTIFGDGSIGAPLNAQQLVGASGRVSANDSFGLTITSVDGKAVAIQAQNAAAALTGASVTVSCAGSVALGPVTIAGVTTDTAHGVLIGAPNHTTVITGGNPSGATGALYVVNGDVSGLGRAIDIFASGTYGLPITGFFRNSNHCGDVIGWDDDTTGVPFGLVKGINLAAYGGAIGFRNGASPAVNFAKFAPAGSQLNGKLGVNIAPSNALDVRGLALFSSIAATDAPLFVNSLVATGPSAVGALDNTGAFKHYLGYFNPSYAFSYVAGKHGLLSGDAAPFVLADTSALRQEFGLAAGAVYHTMTAGSGAAFGPAGGARIRYNESTGKLQVSLSGAAYVDIVTL